MDSSAVITLMRVVALMAILFFSLHKASQYVHKKYPECAASFDVFVLVIGMVLLVGVNWV